MLGAPPGTLGGQAVLDRVCEVMNLFMRRIDERGSACYCWEWIDSLVNTPAFPDLRIDARNANRIQRAGHKNKEKAIWSIIMSNVPCEDMMRKIIRAAFLDGGNPIKLDRFDASVGEAMLSYAMSTFDCKSGIQAIAQFGKLRKKKENCTYSSCQSVAC